MITCKICGGLFVSQETRLRGKRLHTKLNKDDSLSVSCEHYELEDVSGEAKFDCDCGKVELEISCDYCPRPAYTDSKNRVPFATMSLNKKMFACKSHLEELKKADYEITWVNPNSLNFIFK